MPRTKNILISHLLEIRHLTESTFVLRLERNNFDFKAGQYLVLNIPGENNAREYSIYSPEDAPYLELLIKEIIPGDLSGKLKSLKLETQLELSGPFGFFILREQMNSRFIFVATGTGISPFHSMILSNPGLNYRIIHGIQLKKEAYDQKDYPEGSYFSCTSRSQDGDYPGRVTSFLRENAIQKNAYYYLCGNSEMVNEVTEILESAGIPPEQIRTEVFF